jgi:predicted transcriptional regulator
LRLRWEHHLPQRSIGRSLGLSQGSVSDYLNRAALDAGQREADTLQRRGWASRTPTLNRRTVRAPGGSHESDAEAKVMA